MCRSIKLTLLRRQDIYHDRTLDGFLRNFSFVKFFMQVAGRWLWLSTNRRSFTAALISGVFE